MHSHLQEDEEEETFLHPYPYKFTTKYCIGQGSFGKVYQGTNTETNKQVAVKELELTHMNEGDINKEIEILKKLEHPNIVRYEAAIRTSQYFYIVTEYCNGGDLRNLLEDLMESSDEEEQGNDGKKIDKLLDMFFQVCTGFAYLRKFDIIHRDLKPSNILIHNNTFKIGDFGVARTEALNKSLINNDIVGVPIYMSPQILSRNYYSFKCDVWSLGVIMYEYFFQKMPWKAADVNGLFFQIMSNPTPYAQEEKEFPVILKSIFDGTLRYLEKDRLGWDQLLNFQSQKQRRKIFAVDQPRPNNADLEQQRNLSRGPLSLSKMSKEIPAHQVQILTHIVCQCKSSEAELKDLVGEECYRAFLAAISSYISVGPEYRQLFTDSSFFLLKIAGENLHLYMIDLEYLEEARILLVFLEILHDLVTINIKEHYNNFDGFKKAMGGSCSKTAKIDEYAANVISKINTYRLSELRKE